MPDLVARRNGWSMEHTWRISGVNAEWEMVVKVSPPDFDDEAPGDCPDVTFDALAAHFRNLVEMYEAWGELSQLAG